MGERRRRPWKSLHHYAAHTARRYGPMATHKVKQFAHYAQAYPDSNGNFVFVGDDGQGDYLASRDLLRLKDQRGDHLLAFCAIKHARKVGDDPTQDALSPDVRAEMIADARAEAGDDRFFVFETYHDLAAQLHTARWISSHAKNAIVEASAQDQIAHEFFG